MLPTRRLQSRSTFPDPLRSVRLEMDDLFDRFFGSSGGNGGSLYRTWQAPVCLWEDDNHLYLEIEVPGIRKDDLELTIEHGTLRVAAERKEPEVERQYWYNERRYGRMERVIALPEVVDADSIEAELHEGVLFLKLSKRPEAQPKRITVKTG